MAGKSSGLIVSTTLVIARFDGRAGATRGAQTLLPATRPATVPARSPISGLPVNCVTGSLASLVVRAETGEPRAPMKPAPVFRTPPPLQVLGSPDGKLGK